MKRHAVAVYILPLEFFSTTTTSDLKWDEPLSWEARSSFCLCWCFQDTDENGKRGGEVDVPLQMVAKGEVPQGLSSSLRDDVCITFVQAMWLKCIPSWRAREDGGWYISGKRQWRSEPELFGGGDLEQGQVLWNHPLDRHSAWFNRNHGWHRAGGSEPWLLHCFVPSIWSWMKFISCPSPGRRPRGQWWHLQEGAFLWLSTEESPVHEASNLPSRLALSELIRQLQWEDTEAGRRRSGQHWRLLFCFVLRRAATMNRKKKIYY